MDKRMERLMNSTRGKAVYAVFDVHEDCRGMYSSMEGAKDCILECDDDSDDAPFTVLIGKMFDVIVERSVALDVDLDTDIGCGPPED